MPETIDAFMGANAFLSNFYECPRFVEYEGVKYSTVEHAFQAAKMVDKAWKLKIMAAKTPAAAKRLGKQGPRRPDWDSVRVKVMTECVRSKFTRDGELGLRLLNTGGCRLIEGNYWGDTFWGVYNGKGENHLGKILTLVRGELRRGAREARIERRT